MIQDSKGTRQQVSSCLGTILPAAGVCWFHRHTHAHRCRGNQRKPFPCTNRQPEHIKIVVSISITREAGRSRRRPVDLSLLLGDIICMYMVMILGLETFQHQRSAPIMHCVTTSIDRALYFAGLHCVSCELLLPACLLLRSFCWSLQHTSCLEPCVGFRYLGSWGRS